jgi:CheY-like chemotaxis protein
LPEVQVLVVEDEPLICELITSALEDEGVVIACASNADEALAELDRNGASLLVLLTDINLGTRLTGFDVAREARRRIPHLFVLYATGHAEADIATHGVAGSMMVPKPYMVVQLAQQIAELVKVAGRY